MNILIPAQFFYPSRMGGPANALYWLAKGFIHNGHKVTVVTTYNEIIDSTLVPNQWIYLDGIRIKYIIDNRKLSYRLTVECIRELKTCDTVILSSIFYPPFLFIALAAKFHKKRIIWSPRGELFGRAINNNNFKIIYIRFLKSIFSKLCIFHATSDAELSVIKKYFGHNVSCGVIPNLMILPQKLDQSSKRDKYVLYMGRISPIKALENLLMALELSDKFLSQGYKLKIAGPIDDDAYWNKLKQIIHESHVLKNTVEYIGVVSGKQKIQLYADAYVLLLPSHSENFGNVVLEALSQSTPVIASTGTPWEILNYSGSGIWTSNTPEELSDAINKMLCTDAKKYENMRQAAYDLSQKFDVFANITKWNNLLSYQI